MREKTISANSAGSGRSQLSELPGETWQDIFATPNPPDAVTVQVGRVAKPRKQRDSRPRESRCSRCGQTVFWSVTERNRRPIPLDPLPSDDACCGNFIIVEVAGARLARYVTDAQRVALIEGAGLPVWVPHAATCSERRR